jgi:hypothetical protein
MSDAEIVRQFRAYMQNLADNEADPDADELWDILEGKGDWA